jgi:hypothetical protein
MHAADASAPSATNADKMETPTELDRIVVLAYHRSVTFCRTARPSWSFWGEKRATQ